MTRTFIITALLALVWSGGTAQNPLALDFSSNVLREDFDEQNENWTYMTSVENLYMPDKGELFMHRNNQSSAYAFITKWRNELREFNILTRLKLGPAESTEQSIGVICLVQKDGKGALVVEFNRKKQYRIKKLVGAYYRQISGSAENMGWVKANMLKGGEEPNELDIRVSLPQIDVYINGKLTQSFDMPEYGPGEVGIIIGPNTKAKADYFYVFTTPEEQTRLTETAATTEKATTPTEQIAKLRYELEQLDRDLRECRAERQKAVSVLEGQLGSTLADNERLAMQNRQLAEFRDQVLVDIDEDAFLTLASNLKDEILKNDRLEKQVQVYRDSLKLTHLNYNKLKLVLLDKSIKKAEKDKVERDKQDAITTKQEIEAELVDKRMKQEQEEWERKNAKTVSEVKLPESKPAAKPESQPAAKTEPQPAAKPKQDAPVQAAPLPVPVRQATKKND